MVYKKYIKRNGKTFGPYYYESYRDEKGNVKTRFISGPSRKDKIINKINPKTNKKKISRFFYTFFLIVLVLLIPIIFFIGVIQLNGIFNNIGFSGSVFSGFAVYDNNEISKDILSKSKIEITNAEILNKNRNPMQNVYNELKDLDNQFSVPIFPEEYLRLYFAKELTNKNDIIIYAKNINFGSSEIEIYSKDDDRLITKFDKINKENWYRAYLTNLNNNEKYSIFDLKILNNPVKFDYATDPTDCYNSSQNPIPICTCADLNKSRENLSSNFILQNDINFNLDGGACGNWTSGAGWVPIGDGINNFTGNFSGNNHTITGLFINRPSTDFVGLFGSFSIGNISDLGLINVNITGRNNTGGLVGFLSAGTILRSHVSGNIWGNSSVGSIFGRGKDGQSSKIIDSYSSANIRGTQFIGGLVGYIFGANVLLNKTYSIGNVSGVANIGGLGGYIDTDVDIQIRDSFSTGNVSGSSNTGGLVGLSGASISNSFYNNHSGTSAICVGSGSSSGCTAIQNNTAYFYYTNNTPIVNWSFPPWSRSNNGLDFPVLSWQTANCWDSTQNPIPICTCWDLNKTRDNLTTNYILQRNINFTTDGGACGNWTSGSGWEPIGNDTADFTGSFNGNNHTITGLYINRSTTDYIGLFGYVNSSINITDLGLINSSILGNDYVGVLAGYSNITINNVYSTGNLNATSSRAGGLVGENYGNINNSYSGVLVTNTGATRTGGFVGNNFGNIYNSYATGNVSSSGIDHETGGFVGSHQTGATISSSFSTGNVSAISGAAGRRAGFVGWCLGSATNSYWNNISGLTSTCGCSSGCTAIQNNQQYFYNVSNIPLVNWTYPPWDNFCNLSGYPPLKWQSLSNVSNCVGYSASSSDTIYPLFSSYWDNNATLIGSGIALFNVTVTNTNGTVFLQINNTNYTASNLSANVYNASVNLTNGTYSYTWVSWGNGTNKNYNISDTRSYTVNTSVDTSYPLFSSFTQTPANATAYVLNAVYEFNSTLTNTNGTVGIEFNGTNYTAVNLSLSVYNFTIKNLAAGTYSYYFWSYGNGTDKLFNKSNSYSYTIIKASSVIYTYINNSRANLTILNNTNILLNSSLITGTGNILLYNNGTLINNGTGILSNLTGFNNTGIYNITSIYSGNQNFSFSSETWWLNVSVDWTAPLVTINSPTATTYTTSTITFNVTLNEIGYCIYSLSNGITNITMVSNDNLTFYNSSSLADNSYIVNFYCNDSFGNRNDTMNISFSINTYTAPPAPTPNLGGSQCYANWICNEWSDCINNIKTRTCKNTGCGIASKKETKNCIIQVPTIPTKPEEKPAEEKQEPVQETPGAEIESREIEETQQQKQQSIVEKTLSLIAFPVKLLINLFNLKQPAEETICGEWSECASYYNFNDVFENNIFLKGEQRRTCNNNLEIKECTLENPIKLKKTSKCFKNYLEILDINDVLISRMELININNFKKLNIQIVMDEGKYCWYCYDNIKDLDEDEVDCSYEENASCPVCRTA